MGQPRDIRDQVVWVTGASSGIGRELAVQYAELGARVVLTARREEALRETQQRCPEAELTALVQADLSALEELDGVVDRAIGAFGRIDIAVLNAGVSQRGVAAETEPDVVRFVNTVNFLSPAHITRRLVQHMLPRGAGRIVAVSSLSTRVPTPYRSSYTASKAALETYMTVVRRELVGSGVGVTLALPGFVRTNISRAALNADGSTHGVLDPAQQKGMAPEACAQRIVAGVRRGRREILIPSDMRTRIGLFLQRRAPGLLDRMMAGAKVT